MIFNEHYGIIIILLDSVNSNISTLKVYLAKNYNISYDFLYAQF